MIQILSKIPRSRNISEEEPAATEEFAAALSFEQHMLGSIRYFGGPVTYIVSLVNSGRIQYNGLLLLDDFIENVPVRASYLEDSVHYYINGVLQAAPLVIPGPPLSISGITVPPGGNTILVYQAEVYS